MKIAVYGGTGMIGSRVVTEARNRGHEVTALSRSGADGTQVADAGDAASVRAVAAGHDVVVSALGPSRANGADPAAFLDVIHTLIGSVADARLIVVGGAGSLFAAPGVRLFDLAEFPAEYKPEALVQGEALEVLRTSPDGLDWTYLSPAPVIAPGERTGAYQVGTDSPAGNDISAEDYAVALVDEIETPTHRRTRFTVAH